MDAMKLMQKMGWKPGQGLGKHSQGDSTSITVEVKQDNRGVGIPSSADHWDDMYNAAIKSISVASDGKSSKELTKIVVRQPEAPEESCYGGLFVRPTKKRSSKQGKVRSSSKLSKPMYRKRMSGKLKRIMKQDSTLGSEQARDADSEHR
ncbi:G-patch domain-containing protein [Plasmodiophora brassicae]|nr:hypothetical protein PBRA_006198 [Plasmodiophora brassicae]